MILEFSEITALPMSAWWSGLGLELQVFYAIGMTSFLITLIQTALTLIGLGGEGGGVDFDIPEGGHSTGIGLFSVQTISAFFLGFGWGGVLFLEWGLPLFIAGFLAFGVGTILMAGMYFLLVGLLSLQSSGNLIYASAVGSTAEVTVTIPSARSGKGQIQVLINGRLVTAEAETEADIEFRPGQHVRVSQLIGSTDFLVEPT